MPLSENRKYEFVSKRSVNQISIDILSVATVIEE